MVAFSLAGCSITNALQDTTASPVAVDFFTPTRAATAVPTVGAPPATLSAVAARVNGTPILLDTVLQEVSTFSDVRAQVITDSTPLDVAETEVQVLNRLIDQLIIEQQARLMGLEVSAEDLATRAQAIREKAGSREQFEAWLSNNRLSEQRFLSDLETELTAKRLYDKITEDVPFQAEQVSLRYLRIADPHLAQEVEQQLANQKEFSQVIDEQISNNPSYAETGRLDWFPEHAGYLPTEVEQLVFQSQPGKILGPIFVSGKYYFVEMEGMESNRPLALDRQQALRQQVFLRWLHQKRTEANIEKSVTLN